MTAVRNMARQFLADDSFYAAAGQDDGSSEADALRGAEASLAEIRPALALLFEDEIEALVNLLDDASSDLHDLAKRDAIAISSDRIIDVADTLGYRSESRLASMLRRLCKTIGDGGVVAPDIFAFHGKALRTGLRTRDRAAFAPPGNSDI